MTSSSSARAPIIWPGQAEFLESDAYITAAFTGAGFGKSVVLCERVLMDHARQDGWWEGRVDYNSRPLMVVVGAPHEKYLSLRTVPEFKAALQNLEERAGRIFRKKTGRYRDGWYGNALGRRQEMANCVDVVFYPLPTKDSAVAVDVCGFYVDEVTMLTDVEIWRRSIQRVRDSRAKWRGIAVVGTPEEDHFIHEALIDPMSGESRKGVKVITASTLENPKINIEWFEQIGQQASGIFKEMQVLGKWVRGAGGQRFAHVFDLDRHTAKMTFDKNKVMFDIGWDPGYRTGSVIIAYKHRDTWCVVDEIVIKDMTTEEVCDELLRRGYNKKNIRYIGMDPRDADKHRSTSRVTDAEIVYRKIGIRPKRTHVGYRTGEVYVRLDVLETLLDQNKLIINADLLPKSTAHNGIINSIRGFSTRKMKEDAENFVDAPTTETMQRFKHAIDALHYLLMEYEKPEYRKVAMSPTRHIVGH
ncbi:MAG: hypothetical protein VW239_02860 [Candidatus Nanopelagicales bacterium]